MTITTINNIVSSGPFASRPASPSLATPASGSNPSVIYCATDTGNTYMWDFVGAAWKLVNSGGGGSTITNYILAGQDGEDGEDGMPIPGPAGASGGGGGGGYATLLNTLTASSSASLIDTTSITATYDEYLIEIAKGLVPATTNGDYALQFTTDGGLTWDTTSGHYANSNWRWINGGNANGDSTLTQINLNSPTDHVSTSATVGCGGYMRLYQPASTGAPYPMVTGSIFYLSVASNIVGMEFRGQYKGGTAINGFRLINSAGNTATGIVRIWGISH